MKSRLLLLAASVALFAHAGFAADADTNARPCSCCASSTAAADRVSNKSLYQVESTWTNDTGRAMSLAALQGRPQVVTMFFAHCQYACPLLVYKMKQIEAALPENVRTNVGFTLVSFDAERDTPSALHDYRKQQALGGNWTLLHGTEDDILDVAALLGVKFKKDAQGQFMHSNVITVLNEKGEIAYQETGLSLEPGELVRQIQKTVSAEK